MKIRYLAGIAVLSIAAGAAQAQQYAPASQPYPATSQGYAAGADGGPYCREFTQKVMIGGVARTSYGTSCMRPDGSWQIVTQQPDSAPPPLGQDPNIQYAPPPVYAVAGPPVYYGAPYYPGPYFYGPSIGLNFGFGGGHGWYHHGYGGHGGWHR